MCSHQQRDTATPAGEAWCELTVAGALGPVLRHAASSGPASEVASCTVIRGVVPEGWDLADVVRVLEAHGLRADAVVTLGP